MTEAQREIIPGVEFDLVRMRDRAILLLMASARLYRSELARMDLIDVFIGGDVAEEGSVEDNSAEDGYVLGGIRKKSGMPKRDVRAREVQVSEEIGGRLCSARALAAWIVGAGLSGGPLFRTFSSHGELKDRRITPSSINLIVDTAVERAGFDPDDWTPSRLKETPPESSS